MKTLSTIMLVCFASVLFLEAPIAAADEHEPTPDPVPNCCLPECTYWMCITDCHGTRKVKVYCQQGEMECMVDDPCLGLCWFTTRIPALCKPCGTCSCSHCCSQPSSVVVAAAPSCGCEKGNNTVPILAVPTVAPVPTTSVMVQPQCVGGQCYLPQTLSLSEPATQPGSRRFGGGHIVAGNDATSHRVVQLGAININRVKDDDNTDDDKERGSGPLRNVIEKIRNRPSPGPGR